MISQQILSLGQHCAPLFRYFAGLGLVPVQQLIFYIYQRKQQVARTKLNCRDLNEQRYLEAENKIEKRSKAGSQSGP